MKTTTEKLQEFAAIWQKLWAWLYDLIAKFNAGDLEIKDDPSSSFPENVSNPVA